MKPLYKSYYPLLLFLLIQLPAGIPVLAQDSTRKDLLVDLGYHNLNNRAAYLSIHAKTKVEGKFRPVKGARVRVYLDKDSAGLLAGDLTTDAKGEANAPLPPSLKDPWNRLATQTFIAVAEGDKEYNPARAEASVTKAHLQIDTTAGRGIVVSILELKNGAWTPVKGVEIKVGIRRSGSDLPAGDKESYTTDSTGKIEADFKRDGLPGDRTGLLTLVAKVEDNDTYGNLRVERSEPWGAVLKLTDNFNDRSLWAARFKTPFWLLFMEYFIFFSVWSVILYLISMLIKIKKAGRIV
jgi:hypothetical protein